MPKQETGKAQVLISCSRPFIFFLFFHQFTSLIQMNNPSPEKEIAICLDEITT
jgi:hypothetical protein